MDPDVIYGYLINGEATDGWNKLHLVNALGEWIDKGGYVPEALHEAWKADTTIYANGIWNTRDMIWVTLT